MINVTQLYPVCASEIVKFIPEESVSKKCQRDEIDN